MNAILGIVLVAALFAAGWWLSRWLGPDDPAGTHAGRAAAIGYTLGLAWTHITLALGIYGWPAAIGFGVPVLVACRSVWPEVRDGAHAATEALVDAPVWIHGLVAAWCATVIAGSVRIATYPLPGWDAMTYHLVHAARWVRDGRVVRDPSPDAWSYYEWYTTGGDAWWSWFMLGDGSTLGLWLPTLLIFVATLGAAIQTAHAVGHWGATAMAAGLAATSAPALLQFVDDAYVDVHTLLFAALAATFAIRAMRTGAAGDLLATSCAVVAGVAIKDSALLWLPPLLLLPFLSGRPNLRGLAATAAPLLLLGLLWAERLLAHGSPVYPLALPALGGGNELLSATMRCGADCPTDRLWKHRLWILVVPPPVHFGLLNGWLVLPLGGVGMLRRVSSDPRAMAVLLLLIIPAVWVLFSPSTQGMVLGWPMGRLTLTGWLAVVLAVPWALSESFGRWILGGVTGLALLFTLPGDWLNAVNRGGPVPPRTPTELALIFGAIGIALAIAVLAARARRLPIGPLLGAGLLATAAASWSRAPIPDSDPFIDYAPEEAAVWRYLAEREPMVIDVHTQLMPPGPGHNVFRLMLMGANAQHDLTHVSPWASGAHHHHLPDHPPDNDTLDPEAWRDRLAERGVTHVYVQGEVPVEPWLTDGFEQVAGDGYARLYARRP